MTMMRENRTGIAQTVGPRVARANQLLESESDRWFLWIPVCLGIGAGAYFALADEPSLTIAVACLLLVGVLYAASRRHLSTGPMLLCAALLWIAIGFADAKLRTLRLATPLLPHATGQVALTGWLERVERRPGARHRLTISVISIDRLERTKWPERIRLSVASKAEMPPSGAAIAMRARLMPLPEPVAPGAFDFARKAWFAGLGAVGYGLGPPELLPNPPPLPTSLWLPTRIDHWRRSISARIRSALPGAQGELATALITGDRGGIPPTRLDQLRHSGLAHVLAISGMHMAMMAGALFWLVRALLAAVPYLALTRPIKKWAALVALLGAAFYLALSGASIATQRAFVMISIMFVAVLMDRPALTLRNVAIAAILILIAFPESIADVSFQMSFAAVVALVAVYERWSVWRLGGYPNAPVARAGAQTARYLGAVGLTTLVASLAVAPYAAFHFHKLAQFGLLANMLAMPIFGLLVMPMALVSLLAMSFGLEAGPLGLMGAGVEAVSDVAAWVSSLDGAVIYVAAMPKAALILLTLGGLWLCLWRRRMRVLGLAIAACGLLVATGADRPDVLIDREGVQVAARAADGRLRLAENAKAKFSLERWLLADGDRTPVDKAVAAEAFSCDAAACLTTVRGLKVAIIRHPAAIAEECSRADIVVAQMPLYGRCVGAKTVVDRRDLWAKGAHAIYIDGLDVRVVSAAELRGNRPWVLRHAGSKTQSATARANPAPAQLNSKQ